MLDATPLLRFYARRRYAELDAAVPAATQETQLLQLVRRAEGTAFGGRHGFSRVSSVSRFQQAVPLRSYEEFRRDYWQKSFPRLRNCTWPGTIRYFARTAGTTTGRTKFIPVSDEMVAANRRAVLDLLAHHLRNRPESHVLAGKNFMLGGSTDLVEEASGVHSGDLSGIAAAEVPWWARPWFFPPKAAALIADWQAKIDTLARLSLVEDIRTISDGPPWLLIFFEKLAALRPTVEPRIVNFYPKLELLVHGGVNFAPYRQRFAELLDGSRAELREVYPASEGFIAIADRGPDEGLRLLLDNGLFFEFVPVEEIARSNPTRHWVADAVPKVNYALVLTSNAGLWSYVLGDTVTLIDRNPPRIRITGRTSYTLSAFGEHLIDAEIEEAVASAAAAIGLTINDYVVGPVFPLSANDRGRHVCVVEFAERLPSPDALASFARTLDRMLMATNEDYKAHRADGFGLQGPEARAVPAGSFAAWMASRGMLGGQHKVPRIVNDPELLRRLLDFMRRRAASER